MVVDGGGSLRRELLGDMTATNVLANGWTGFVIYGLTRDVDVTVNFAGVTIHAGDFIACDNNGIIVSPVSLDV